MEEHHTSGPGLIPSSPTYAAEGDALHPHTGKNAKVAAHSVISTEKSIGSSGASKDPSSAEWLPYTLRLSLVWIPTVLSLILALVVGLLYWRSHQNHGLCAESAAVTGWRFAPTLVAVLWAQLITMLFNDIQRTEPFARLARSPEDVPPASRTILEGPRQVWTAFAHAFNKKHNGGKRSWIIIWASVVLVISSIVISLSSALLASEEIELSQPFQMTRLVPKPESTLAPSVVRDTYFRTTGAILQGVTTSPWISDDYAVLPFWPSESAVSPWDAQYPSMAQKWEAETTVFRNDLQCSPLNLTATDIWSYNYTYYSSHETEYRMSIRLENDAGCNYNLTFNASDRSEFNSWEVGSWSSLDTFLIEERYAKTSQDADNHGDPFKPTYNDKCQGDEIMFMSSQWLSHEFWQFKNSTAVFLPNLTITSYLCQSEHMMAQIPVRVSTSASDFHVDIDDDAFQKAKQKVPSNVLDTSKFVKSGLDPQWYSMIPKINIGPPLPYGAMALLATQYEFDFYKMKNDTKLPQVAARAQRRHFGEILRTSLDVQGASRNEGIVGSTTMSERRITVRMEAAAALVALFIFTFLTMLGITWLSSVRRRPLHLTHEPATVLGTVSLVSSDPSVLQSIQELDQASTAELRSALKGRYFSTSHGHLKEVPRNGQIEVEDSTPRIPTLAEKETPMWVKIRILIGLVFYIVVLIMAITVVHRFASESNLNKGFFTYHVNINAMGHLGSFTPFSIVPTTLAVLLGLWWNGLDHSFRSLQPYISMSQAPKETSRGLYVSYQSSCWLWATGKAAKNQHWLLSLVTLGTFLAQAFTIATSALFEQTTGNVNNAVQLNRGLELRQIPHIRLVNETYPPSFGGGTGVYGFLYVGVTLKDLFMNLTNNWLYSSVIQATLNGSEPDWSKDGWSFVPLNLSQLSIERSDNNTGLETIESSLINVTLTTPAIRGRVECYQPEEIRNGSTTWNQNSTHTDPETNKTEVVNMPNYRMFGGPLAPDSAFLSCCFNSTEPGHNVTDPAPVAVGFWTQDSATDPKMPVVATTINNFTVKWLYGDGAGYGGFGGDQLHFPKVLPKIQAVKCMPIFETAEAELVVDKQNNRVLSHRILDEPIQDDSAWTDSFVIRDLTDPNDPVTKKQIEDTKVPCTSNYTALCTRPMAMQNLTNSYGVLFMNSLLRAARLGSLMTSMRGETRGEDLTDNVFNIRDNVTGLTLDFMSYAAYVKAGRNPEALLDLDYMMKSTKEMFSLFFQHYVSSTVSLKTGGWAFQPIGANLDGLGAVTNESYPQFNPDGTRAKNTSDLPALHTERTANATMSTRVEVLHMNPTAVWLCVALLIWLAITTIIVVALQRWFIGDLRRPVETIADVLVLVAGSERLLAAVEKYGVEGLRNSNVKTRLGWFRTEDGRMRYGIEIVEEGEVLMN